MSDLRAVKAPAFSVDGNVGKGLPKDKVTPKYSAMPMKFFFYN